MKIGSKYEQNVRKLMGEILDGKVKLREFPNFHARCYFCGGHISGKVTTVSRQRFEKEVERTETYFIDGGCLEKIMGTVQRN